MTPIQIGTKWIGPGKPVFLAAEVGINHNGDIQLAHETIDAAADANADAVKFQYYHTQDFLSNDELTYEYISEDRTVVESQLQMFKRCELRPEWLVELKAHCERRKLIFFATPSGTRTVRELCDLGVGLLKNASDSLVHLPLIQEMARTGIPTVLSTGMSTLSEIDDAVRAFREAGGTQLVLLHCTSSYPTPPRDVHLRKIPTLAAAFNCLVGLSDHTWGIAAAIGAVALGGCMVEKHFTLSKKLPGPDHRFSADPAEFSALVSGVRMLEESLGDTAIGPTESEAGARCDCRLSCVAVRDLPPGHQLSNRDLAFRRPGTGFPPSAASWLVGRRLSQNVRAGQVLQLADLV